MGHAFQEMLISFSIQAKVSAAYHFTDPFVQPMQIHSFTADNASNNNTQTTTLDALDNSFKGDNQVFCFNHTLQLSANSLLKPFTRAGANADSDASGRDNIPDLEDINETDEDDTDDDDSAHEEDTDELNELDEDSWNELLVETADVCATLSKVCTVSLLDVSV